jgi:hypothetical protein
MLLILHNNLILVASSDVSPRKVIGFIRRPHPNGSNILCTQSQWQQGSDVSDGFEALLHGEDDEALAL